MLLKMALQLRYAFEAVCIERHPRARMIAYVWTRRAAGQVFSPSGMRRSPNRKLGSMPERCEVIEIRNSADADGFPCSRTASMQCFDCGSELCESHTETCGICNGIFCPSCFSFHSVQHSKPASADHGQDRERKRA